jgi:endonuclease/exonuclease/phosphatase family metal-dependent hydrolase
MRGRPHEIEGRVNCGRLQPVRALQALLVWCWLVAVAPAASLTVATYNIQNYGPADRMTESGYRTAYPKPEEEKRALRAVILALNADVLVLQEMGGPAYLEELRRDLKAAGLDYPHQALAEAADPDRHVALLSKVAPVAVRTHADLEFPYFVGRERVKRGVLEASFAAASGEMTLFAVHLKSRLTERDDDPLAAKRRGAEATAVRDLVLRRFPQPASARFLILGDCNDGRTSRPLAYLQKRGATEIARLLHAADSRGETWSYHYAKEETYSRVDHILVSPALMSAVQGGAARIYDGPEAVRASDHRPVMVVIEDGKK